jgi:hypothetical protein
MTFKCSSLSANRLYIRPKDEGSPYVQRSPDGEDPDVRLIHDCISVFAFAYISFSEHLRKGIESQFTSYFCASAVLPRLRLISDIAWIAMMPFSARLVMLP